MPQRASVFCNFYIRVDREALVSERALDVGSVAFKAMSTKILLLSLCTVFFFCFPFLSIVFHYFSKLFPISIKCQSDVNMKQF
jgi:hypothetical protein